MPPTVSLAAAETPLALVAASVSAAAAAAEGRLALVAGFASAAAAAERPPVLAAAVVVSPPLPQHGQAVLVLEAKRPNAAVEVNC